MSLSSAACDLCGCYMGVQPQVENNAIGLRWRYRFFSGNVPHFHGDGIAHHHDDQEPSRDHYHTLDLYTRYYPHPKVQLYANVPYVSNVLYEGDKFKTFQGIGDAMLIAQYRLLFKDDMEKNRALLLFAGGGIKLPTGSYNKPENNGEIEPHSQTGTGSIDYLINATFTSRRKKVGISADASYKINGTNKNGFRFADRFNASAHGFYWMKRDNLSFVPNAGFYFETAEMDQFNERDYLNTGGAILFGSVGFDFFIKKLKVSFTGQLPAYEHLTGYQLNNKFRIISGVAYHF